MNERDLRPWEQQQLAHALVALGALMGFGRWCPDHPHRRLLGPDFTCRGCKYDRDRRRRERQNAIRKPPRPPHERTPNACSMCGTPPPGRRISWCSDACVDLWDMATRPKASLGQLVELHGFRCWCCGDESLVLEVDHIRPLWSLTDAEREELRWWLPFNLQLLCLPCHKAKTKREAGERARARSAAGPTVAMTLDL